MGKRIVAFDSDNVAVGVYDTVEIASRETHISKHDIARNLQGFGPTFIRGLTFRFEVTNKELREARLKDRKHRQAQILKKLQERFKGEQGGNQ